MILLTPFDAAKAIKYKKVEKQGANLILLYYPDLPVVYLPYALQKENLVQALQDDHVNKIKRLNTFF